MNQRSTPEGAKVNGSQNWVKERCFALLSMTNNVWVNCYIISFYLFALETNYLVPLKTITVGAGRVSALARKKKTKIKPQTDDE